MVQAADDARVAWLQERVCHALAADHKEFTELLQDESHSALLEAFFNEGADVHQPLWIS